MLTSNQALKRSDVKAAELLSCTGFNVANAEPYYGDIEVRSLIRYIVTLHLMAEKDNQKYITTTLWSWTQSGRDLQRAFAFSKCRIRSLRLLVLPILSTQGQDHCTCDILSTGNEERQRTAKLPKPQCCNSCSQR